MTYEHDVFDDAVFGTLLLPRSARVSARPTDREEANPAEPERQEMDLDVLVHQSMLSFSGLMASDRAARVVALDRGYRVELGNQRFAFDMGQFRHLLEEDNPGIDLSFSDELVNYQPEDGLVRKSKTPLWVLRPMGAKTVVIERIW